MHKPHTPHHHFASFFKKEENLQPYAYAASKSLAEGSICINTKGNPEDFLEGFQEAPEENFSAEELRKIKTLVGNENDVKKPFVLHGENFYITRYFNYETQIIEGIRFLIGAGEEHRKSRFDWLANSNQFRKLIEKQEIKEGADWQLVASVMAFLNNFSIITGGPGTGKTTTVAKILGLLYEEDPELVVKLAAPTGKAAMRMKESLSTNDQISSELKEKIEELQPFTLHRLLGPKRQSPYFKHNAENPVEADVIIVDEASMIDVALFSKLISAIGQETRLVLLGDRNQLASVEAGSLLSDLCATVPEKNYFSSGVSADLQHLVPNINLEGSGANHLLQDHITELKYSWRFEKNPDFRAVSEAVINNEKEKIKSWFGEEGLKGNIKLDPEYDEKLFNNFISAYEEYIQKNEDPTPENIAEAIKKFNQLRILAVLRNGKNGVAGLNARVEKYLSKKKLIDTSTEFYEFRPVMVTRNHPDLNLFNGDIGIVRKDPEDNKKTKIWFLAEEQKAEKTEEEQKKQERGDVKVRGYSPALLTDVETVFAMTVHKSQGSEFEKVLLVMPKVTDLPLLTRELLYTGITRAKSELILQGTEEVILKAAEGQVKRASGITSRI
ncbi:exodeoxyribonuclease V subunit alpha [uncultured Salegentibacter sp.]|uniref:exodeoxyribonuclease V subunit alpha n=1 Tax=uncultured Salegentibacter sp. TaxID=259320 RepID=UPI0025996A8A|nr:exodeoxyribonuclease V subunit alpha [uncultured Salegentibacter sp.]